jgi:polyhydroxyalkanoate synthase
MLEKMVGNAARAGERAMQWISIAIERQLQTENFIVANQTPHEIIHRKGLLSVRKYPPLTETEIQVGDATMKVRKRRHKVPVVLIPPLAADPLNFDLMPHRSLVRYLLAQGSRSTSSTSAARTTITRISASPITPP